MIGTGTLQTIGIPLFFFGAMVLSAADAPEGASSRAPAGRAIEQATEDAPVAANKSAQAERRDWLSTASLEELMQVRVTSAARKEQSLFDVPAAMFVVTREDIRRSGASTIPDAMRMVPGLHVAQVSASSWAISARGFTGRYANKMLVLIDGRSVYTNAYSGVWWEHNDLLMEDIDRIEVIRGPGATMWGANAVNGVINIITRPAGQTQGTMVSLQSGTAEPYSVGLRYGGKAGENFHYRIYGKAFSRGPQLNSLSGGFGNADDRWQGTQFGMRADWNVTDRDTVTVQASTFDGNPNQTVYADSPVLTSRRDDRRPGECGQWHGPAALETGGLREVGFRRAGVDEPGRARGIRRAGSAGDAGCRLPASLPFDRTARSDVGRTATELPDEIRGSLNESGEERVTFTPPSVDDSLYTAFLQDEISLIPKRLTLTLGTKLQHNPYTGLEVQPNTRLLWAPREKTSVWGAVSRAVRLPSRGIWRWLAASRCCPRPRPPVRSSGSLAIRRARRKRSFLTKPESGANSATRFPWMPPFFRLTTTGCRGTAIHPPVFEFAPQPRLVFPVGYSYDHSTTNRGLEVASTWTVRYGWKLMANYSYLFTGDSQQIEPVRHVGEHRAGTSGADAQQLGYRAGDNAWNARRTAYRA